MKDSLVERKRRQGRHLRWVNGSAKAHGGRRVACPRHREEAAWWRTASLEMRRKIHLERQLGASPRKL